MICEICGTKFEKQLCVWGGGWYGGTKFKIKMFDTGEVIETNNLRNL